MQKMVYVNKVIGCGNLEQFDVHDLIMVFLSSSTILRTPRTIWDINPNVTASSHWFVICFIPLTSANVIWYSYHGPTRNRQGGVLPRRNFGSKLLKFSGGIRTSWLGGCPCRLNPYSKEPYFYHYMAHRLKTRVFISHVHEHPHQVTTPPPLWTSTHWQHKVHIYLPNLKAGTMIIHAHAGFTSSRQDKASWDWGSLTTSRFKIYKFSLNWMEFYG